MPAILSRFLPYLLGILGLDVILGRVLGSNESKPTIIDWVYAILKLAVGLIGVLALVRVIRSRRNLLTLFKLKN